MLSVFSVFLEFMDEFFLVYVKKHKVVNGPMRVFRVAKKNAMPGWMIRDHSCVEVDELFLFDFTRCLEIDLLN